MFSSKMSLVEFIFELDDGIIGNKVLQHLRGTFFDEPCNGSSDNVTNKELIDGFA